MKRAASNYKALNAKGLADIRKFLQIDSRAALQAINKEALLNFGWALIRYTPVGDPTLWKKEHWPKGYVPGQMKANWQVGIDGNVPQGYFKGLTDKTGVVSMQRLEKLGRWTLGHTYHFVNNVPYAYVIETGTHSTQVPPQGIVGRAKREWKQIVRQAVQDVRTTGNVRIASGD